MPSFPIQLKYELSRSQRLVPLVREFGLLHAIFIVMLFTFFAERTVASIMTLTYAGIAVFGGLAFGLFMLHGNLFMGLLEVLFVRARKMDVIFETEAAGIMFGKERWYMFLDGITDLRKYRHDTWTIRHWNGTILHINADGITDDLIEHMRNAVERGRTPEGFQAVIERGKRIEAIMQMDEASKSENASN